MRRNNLRAILALVFVAGFGTQAFARPTLASLKRLSREGLRVSAEIVSLGPGGQVLAHFHAGRALIPASLSKLYVAEAALSRLGARHRFALRIETTGPIVDGILHGALVVVDPGDPALVNDRIARVARWARILGLRRVQGPLVLVLGGFGRPPCRLVDRCRAQATSHHAYNAPLSSIAVNYGTYDLVAAPGPRRGAPARVAFDPFQPGSVGLDNRATTGAPGTGATLAITQKETPTGAMVSVRGTIAWKHPPVWLYVASPHPDQTALATWSGCFSRSGIAITDGARIEGQPPPGARLWFKSRGVTLETLLDRMLAYSNNFIADELTLDLAPKSRGARSLTLPQASTALARELWPTLRHFGASPRIVLRSGSGLSPQNRSSASDLIALLRAMYQDSMDFPAFWGALPPPAESPFAFLRRGQRIWRERFFVKTGTLNAPFGVLGLAGYFRLPGGRFGAFAILVNGSRRHPNISIGPMMRILRHTLEAWASHGAGQPVAAASRSTLLHRKDAQR
ncbi:MAG: D-alanyl-D-alanine carboxypeptidase/D-alanyl-D-alanine-endopeptidase [Gammaproteobacteria bacterium]